MPGIFGCLVIDPTRRLEESALESIFNRMVARLKHLDSYAIDCEKDPSGAWMIGRIGHENLLGKDLVHDTGSFTIRTRFYGVLSDDSPETDGVRHDGRDPLLDIALRSGYFSAFCVDESNRRLAIVVDRKASEPVYYAEYGGILYFAPEVKALAGLDLPSGELDPGSLASLMGSGYLLPHQTLFTNIRKLTSRHALVIENMRFQESEYWKYEPGSRLYGGSPDTMREELAGLVQSSILRDFGAAKDTITFLSGGLDSRYILACIMRNHQEQASSLNAVTWAEKIDAPGSDAVVASEVARVLGIRHQFQARRHDRYRDWFRECNYLLDGQSDVAADHPHEFQIMRGLRDQGFARVIRGDEAFGLRRMVYSPEAALANIEIRPFAGIDHMAGVMREDWYARACSASAGSFKLLAERGRGMHPVDFKDICYFSLRAPTYLSSAAYYKQILFDHRNPLLSNELMDFYRYVPVELRLDKKLFFQAFAFAHPDLARIPYSSVSGTEDWGILIATDTPVRRMIEDELADQESGVWEIFDREKVTNFFRAITIASGTKTIPAWKQPLRKVRDFAAVCAPARMDRLALRRAQGKIRASQLLFRIMTLKNWHDTFYSGRLDPPA